MVWRMFTALVFLATSVAFGNDASILRSAQERFAEFMESAAASPAFGVKQDEIKDAVLGDPIPMVTLDDSKAAYGTSTTLEDFITSDTVWLVPVKIHKRAVGYLHLEKQTDGQYKVVQFGYAGLASRMDGLQPKKGGAYIVQSRKLTHFFLHSGTNSDDLTAYGDFDQGSKCSTDSKSCFKHKSETFVRIQAKLKEGKEWNAK